MGIFGGGLDYRQPQPTAATTRPTPRLNPNPRTTPRFTFIMGYVWATVAVYPVGVPATLLVLMWRHRAEIETRASRDGGEELSALSFIFSSYARKKWHYAVIDVMRRLLLTSMLLALPSVSFVLTFAFCVSLMMATLTRESGQYWDASSDVLAYDGDLWGWA